MKLLPVSGVYFDTMSEYYKVSEYAQLKDINERTVYRWIKNGDINAREIDGVLHVEVDDNRSNESDIVDSLKSEICQLRQDIEFLQRRLEQAQETIDSMQEERQKAQERSDTIIMQLTKQLEQQTLMLQDMRHRSIWRRLKAVFAPVA
jgi:chromosome segregation ATPase